MEAKAYIFDLDGTLVDSMTDGWIVMLKEYLAENGVAYSSELIKSIIALGLFETAIYFKENLGFKKAPEEIVQDFKNALRVRYEEDIPQKPNVRETLVALKGRGASLNVLTASPHEFLDPCLKRLKTYDLFDNVWSVDDFTSSKAEPCTYVTIASKLGCKIENCVMVDDSVGAIKPAKEAGMQTVGVYDEFSAEFEEEMRACADRYIHNFIELL